MKTTVYFILFLKWQVTLQKNQEVSSAIRFSGKVDSSPDYKSANIASPFNVLLSTFPGTHS
jgi:hypothetical protein